MTKNHSRFVCVTLFASLFCVVLDAQQPAVRNYLKLPLAFESQGTGAGRSFVARGQAYAVGVRQGKATIHLLSKQDQTGRAISIEFAGSRPAAAMPGPELPGKVNYIRGNDPRKWQTGLSTWECVKYPNVYPRIDLVYYGNQQQLEFDLVVKPGADPRSIRMRVGGVAKLSLDGAGAIHVGSSDLRIELPRIYQDASGAKKTVSGHYSIHGGDEVRFRVDAYDRTRPLVIDPTIVYSAVVSGADSGNAVAVDPAGNILVAGETFDWPGGGDGFVTKINAAGTALIYSTYIGGSQDDSFQSIAVDATGAAWVAGSTSSPDFPVLNPTQSTCGGLDAVVVKLNASGGLIFSSYLGGSSIDYRLGIAVDSSGNAYVTGNTGGPFPTTAGTIQPPSPYNKAFVGKFSPIGRLLYSTLLGGNDSDSGYAVAADSSGNAYVTGSSYSATFAGAPAGGAQTTNGGGGDAFVAKLNATGTALLYFTFLGGPGADSGQAIAVDSAGNAYIGGQTNSAGLATAGAAQTSPGGATDGFAAKLNAAGSAFAYVTYLGGSRQDRLQGLALDGSGNVYLAGDTMSPDFPVASALQPALPGNGVSLFQSTNSGSSWSPDDGNIPGALADLSVDPANPAIMVAATESGIHRTVNGGASWTLQMGAFSSGVSNFARSPVASGTLYALGCCSSVYRSTDNGITWNNLGSPSIVAEGILADPLTVNTVYLFGVSSVFKSTDGGVTWNPAAIGLPRGLVVSMAATSDGAIYAATNGSGVYKSTNQGASWTGANIGLPQNVSTFLYSLSASGTTVYFHSEHIYKTTNGGASWTQLPSPLGGSAVTASPQNAAVLYAQTSSFDYGNSVFIDTVQVSTDGGSTWGPPGAGLPANLPSNMGVSHIVKVVIDPTNSSHAFAVTQGNDAAFVAKLNSTGSALIWSTFLGGWNFAQALGIATDSPDSVVVLGFTEGQAFPVTSSSLSSGPAGTFVTVISDATASCSATTVSPGNTLLSNAVQTFTFGVMAPSGCAWTASSSQSWAVVTSGESGIGVGIVVVQISYNSTATRTAVLTIGSRQITLTQPGASCVYSLDRDSYSIGAAGGAIPVVLTATAGCPWAVTNNNPWAVTVTSSASGTGSSTISLTIAPNLSALNRYLSLNVVGAGQVVITQSAALQLTTVTPCRVLDTRNPNGPLGGPFIGAGTTRTIPIPTSSCNIPVYPAAYALNITVVPRNKGPLGYLTVWPADQPQPDVSTLNSPDGSILANAAVVPADINGFINVFALNDTDVIIDIYGYFVPPGAGTLQFFPLMPCRVLDTRNPTGAFGGPAIPGGASRSFPIASSGCGAPSNAAAYSFNVTAVPKGPLGYLTAYPAGGSVPNVSTLNSLDGTIVANAAIIPAGTVGAVSLYASNTTDVVVDINGYFAPPAAGGLNLFTGTPCRVVDTRDANGPLGGPILSANTTRTFPLPASGCGLPATAAAYSLNVTVVPSGPLGYLTAWPTGQPQPNASTLNAPKGLVVANAALVPAGTTGSIDVYALQTTHVIIDVNGYFQ